MEKNIHKVGLSGSFSNWEWIALNLLFSMTDMDEKERMFIRLVKGWQGCWKEGLDFELILAIQEMIRGKNGVWFTRATS